MKTVARESVRERKEGERMAITGWPDLRKGPGDFYFEVLFSFDALYV